MTVKSFLDILHVAVQIKSYKEIHVETPKMVGEVDGCRATIECGKFRADFYAVEGVLHTPWVNTGKPPIGNKKPIPKKILQSMADLAFEALKNQLDVDKIRKTIKEQTEEERKEEESST